MVQVLKAIQKPSFGRNLAEGIGQALPQAIDTHLQRRQAMQQMAQQNEAMKQSGFGDLIGLPEHAQKAAIADRLKGQRKQQEFADIMSQLRGQSEQGGIQESGFDPTEISDESIVGTSFINPAAGRALGHAKDVELRERREKQKMSQKENLELQKQRQPFITEIINKANSSRRGIENKQNLLNIIDQGNLDDPTWAVFAENLPLDLGKRLLSSDTLTYKAGLVDEFTDLRNIFQGQTRIKEIDLLENKLADTYLTDQQKKAVLKARVNALQADLIKEEVASQIEEKYPNLTPLQFNKKVAQEMVKRSDALGQMVINDIKNTFEQAELKKKIPLNPSNPEDKEIMSQIWSEAGGNKSRAKELAKSKGYTW